MSDTYTAKGTIHHIGETQTFPSGFCKREFVIRTGDPQYPQDVNFSLLKDNAELVNGAQIGEPVTVHFNLRGRQSESNGRYYNELVCWKLERSVDHPQQQTAVTANPPQQQAVAANGTNGDDIPF